MDSSGELAELADGPLDLVLRAREKAGCGSVGPTAIASVLRIRMWLQSVAAPRNAPPVKPETSLKRTSPGVAARRVRMPVALSRR